MPVLDAIVDATRATLPELRGRRKALERGAADRAPAPDFVEALGGTSVALIAEVKRRSPSAGAINEDLDPATRSRAYADGGAAAISVLTEPRYFGGSLSDLEAVVAAVPLPVLRKDFVLDEMQLLEARAAGASAALLIVRVLPQPVLERLTGFAASIGLATLVETHNRGELSQALDTGARVIGVNARDLDTLMIDTAAAWDLLSLIPSDHVAVAESGMATRADVARAAAAGADAVLIGSALARDGDPAGRAGNLGGVGRRGR